MQPERRFHNHFSSFGRPLSGPGFAFTLAGSPLHHAESVRHPAGCPFA